MLYLYIYYILIYIINCVYYWIKILNILIKDLKNQNEKNI